MKRTNQPGFCIDTGAPSSVIGFKKLRRIASRSDRRLISFKRFRFAKASFQSLGRVDISQLTPNYIPPIYVIMDIVAVDVPALLGSDIIDMHSFLPDTVLNCPRKRTFTKSDHGKVKDALEWSPYLVERVTFMKR